MANVISRSQDELREIILTYLFNRNSNSTSRRGKSTGAAVTISVMRSDLKSSHNLSSADIHSNLTYLISQGWVEDQPIQKSFTTKTGGVVPAATSYFIITAAGIDRIGGPSTFKRDRFEGIKIEATGQNIITLGDGNQINAQFKELGEALSNLRQALKSSPKLDESQKLDLVTDVDTLQSQLTKHSPNQAVVGPLWEGLNRAASIAGLTDAAIKVGGFIKHLLG